MANENDKLEIFEQSSNELEKIKDKTKFLDRRVDKGFVNDKTGASVGVRENGEVVVAASNTAQYKINPESGAATEVTLQSNTITNRKNIVADEIVINRHKMNPQLVNLADIKQMPGDPDKAMGNLTMFATVLVKAWEPHLNKYVMIRRLARMPMFSPELNMPDAPEAFGLDTNISEELKKLSKEE